MPTTRPARIPDAPRITELLAELGYAADLAVVESRVASALASRTDAVLVAEVGGVVAGVASLHAFDLFHQAGRIGRITSLVVASPFQRMGAGAALIDAADAFFLGAGCIRAEVTSADHRAGAHAFYESQGYLPDERRFLKRYDRPDRSGGPPTAAAGGAD